MSEGDNIRSDASVDGSAGGGVSGHAEEPPRLAAVLGEQTITESIGSFVDYLETSIVVHERDGSQVGSIQVGNDYCSILLNAGSAGKAAAGGASDSGWSGESPCTRAGREVAMKAMRRGDSAEMICPGGFLLYASPIFANSLAIGACVGSISETPTGTDEVRDIADAYGVDVDDLRRAALACNHKPVYLYEAGRGHIRRLAKTLERLYESAVEREAVIAKISLLLTAVESSREGVIVIDLDGKVISINNSGADMLGPSVDELVGSHMGQYWSPGNPEGLSGAIFRETLAGGWEGQALYRTADGRDLPVYVSSAPVMGSDDKPTAMVGIFRDISEEQRMTEEILRRNRELAVINAISTTGAKSVKLEAMLQDSVDTLVKTMNYDAGMVFVSEPATGALTCEAQYGVPEDAARSMETEGVRFVAATAAAGAPVFIDDLEGWSAGNGADSVKSWFTSTGSIPIVSKDRCLGVLSIFTFDRHHFDELEQSLLVSVGKSLGISMERARLFDDVARGKAEWESTFDALTNGVSIHDRDFNIMRANRSLSVMLGIPNEELIGRKCYEVFHGRTKPIPGCPHMKACESGRNETTKLVEPFLDATVFISADPIFNGDGATVIGTAHDVRDITEEERLREQLSQSERLRALGEMAGGVAHDFNNYLTIILGNAQLLLSQEDGSISDDVQESLETIERAAAEAGETVRRIQEFTRVRTTRVFSTVDVNRVVSDAVDVSRPRWKDEAIARGAEIEVLMHLGEVPPVNANASELGEVMMNLILNATDALPRGGVIEVESRQSEEWVEIIVADDGIGMDEETVKRIFDPFFTTKGPGGVGLGLSVAYGIVNRHGGDIAVESARGRGTRFRIRLPVATVADLTGELPEQLSLDAERQARVLVIDDMEMVRTLLTNLLEGMGHLVVTAASGAQGVETISDSLKSGKKRFDLVMTDLGMPGMSGWEVTDAIKQMSPGTPVALITGWGDQLDQERMDASGIDSVVAKPFTIEQVRELVTDALKP